MSETLPPRPDAAAEGGLPVFYKSAVPLSAERHGRWGLLPRTSHRFAQTNALPITIDEFAAAQASMPIVFLPGGLHMPVVLLGMRANDNVFVDAEGKWASSAYLPAYVRRYPFMLMRPAPAAEPVLCIDETAEVVSKVGPANLFDGTQMLEPLSVALTLCQRFEEALMRTRRFVERLKELDLFMPAEMSIQAGERPTKLNGFVVVAEDRVRKLPPGRLADLHRSGSLGLIYAHWFSFNRLRSVLSGKPLPPTARF